MLTVPRKPALDSLPKLRHKSTHLPATSPLPQPYPTKKLKSSSYLLSRPKHKSLSKLQHTLSVHRTQFQQQAHCNDFKLNHTSLKTNLNQKLLQITQKLQKRKVFTLQKHEFPSRHNPKHSLIHDPHNLNSHQQTNQIYTGPLILLDYKIQMSWLNHACYDTPFPLARIGATLAFKDDSIYLFGGNADNPQSNLMFHRYKLNTSQWHHVHSQGQKPMLSLMYHTCTSHKDYLIFVGGVCLNKNELKKFNNPHINLFNTQNNIWTEYHWGNHLKHHSASMIGNFLFVYGGVDERDRTENTVHLIQLNFANLNFSKVNTFRSSESLSHHRAVTTINDDSRLRTKFKLDGLIVFGGKRGNEKLSGELMYLEASSLKMNDEDPSQVKKWMPVEIKGPKPEPRMCHSFDLLANKGLCVMMGGIGEHNQYLSDLWVLDLFHLSWTRVDEVPLLEQTGGMAYHCSLVNDSQIYIYGGITKQQTGKQFYMIETQKFKRQAGKQHSRKKITFSSNLISFKALE